MTQQAKFLSWLPFKLLQRSGRVIRRKPDFFYLFDRQLLCANFVLVAFLFLIPTAPAIGQQLHSWTNVSNSNSFWHVGSNWNPTGPPGGTDTAVFDQNATYDVFWNSTTASGFSKITTIDVQAGDVTFLNLENFQLGHVVNGNLSVSGSNADLTNRGLNLVSSGIFTSVSDGATFLIDGSHVAGSKLTSGSTTFVPFGKLTFSDGAQGSLSGGLSINDDNANEGIVEILNGSNVTSGAIVIGNGATQPNSSSGSLVVDGIDSSFNVTGASGLTIGNAFGTGNHKVEVTEFSTFNMGTGLTSINKSGRLTIDRGSFSSNGAVTTNGQLRVSNGGTISNTSASLATTVGSEALARISGTGSNWSNVADLTIGVRGAAFFEVEQGATVSNLNGVVGVQSGSEGFATVQGAGSSWTNFGNLDIGNGGSGSLFVLDNGIVNTNGTTTVGKLGFLFVDDASYLGNDLDVVSNGQVQINSGAFSTINSQIAGVMNVNGGAWNNTGDLNVGNSGSLSIGFGGLVRVNGATTVGPGGVVNMAGGQFAFGTTDIDSFGRMNGSSGSLDGVVNHSAFSDLGTLSSLQKPGVDMSQVTLANSGTLIGSAFLDMSLSNQTTGEVRTVNGDFTRFAGANNVNRGELNNFGGTIEFAQSLNNVASGFIGGRGVFSAGGGWKNEGVMAFNGTTDILGDVNNITGAQIVTSGGATTTFFDDLVHNGTEIRTSAGGKTVIFGEATGGGAYTGTGTVFFEGDLRPGNSPAVVEFEGDVVLGLGANSFFELAGLETGEFDQMLVAGDLFLDGELQVELIDGFELSFNDSFLIADIAGDLSGQFSGLDEGDLVGNLGGKNLFISYAAGNGNDVSLFTAVPEPSGLVVLCLLGLGFFATRRRRSGTVTQFNRGKVRCRSVATHILLVGTGVLSLSEFSSSASAQGRTDTIAETQLPTGTGGEFRTFSNLSLTDDGQIGFRSFLQNTAGGVDDDAGIYLWDSGTFTEIAREGQLMPGSFTETFTSLGLNSLNQQSVTGLYGGNSDGSFEGVYSSTSPTGTSRLIARTGGGFSFGDGRFTDIGSISGINDDNQVAFTADLELFAGGTASGIYRGSSSSFVFEIVRTGVEADGGGTFAEFNVSSFRPLQLNRFQQVAFEATLDETPNGTQDDRGLFVGSSIFDMVQVAREGQVAIDGNGELSSFRLFGLNDRRDVMFTATLRNTLQGIDDDAGLYLGTHTGLVTVAREGQAAPDGNGKFSRFSLIDPQLTQNGQIGFSAVLVNSDQGSFDDSGLYLWRDNDIQQIMRSGQLTPDGDATLDLAAFGDIRINESGVFAFESSRSDNFGTGLYLSDGIDTIEVALPGDPLLGVALNSVNLGDLNNFGEVAYTAFTNDSRSALQLYTPDLHYRKSADGSWDDRFNWTLGLDPKTVHDVFIDPNASFDVEGPAGEVSVRNLEIGGGTGIATLNLAGGNIQSENGIQVTPNGRLTGVGQITINSPSSALRNGGVITPDNITVNGNVLSFGEINGNGRLNVSGQLVNQLFIKGNVEISAAGGITNTSTGQFRVGSGESMRVNGFSNSFTNQGTLEVIGGELEIQGPTTNAANTGFIALRDGTIRFNDGQLNTGLTNDGSIGVSFGTSDFFGDINNTTSGVINIAGGANATFYDDVSQNGTMVVASVGQTNSAAVFFGSFGGTGGFTGGGDVFAFGDLRPGASPASVLMDGNLFLAGSTATEIELAGLGFDEFDQLVVTGDLGLGGQLSVDLIDGFELTLGDEFLIADVAGDLSGQFSGLSEGDLIGNFSGKNLFISYAAGDGNDVSLFTAVPEPSTTVVLGLLGMGLVLVFRRRNRSAQLPHSVENKSQRKEANRLPTTCVASVLFVSTLVAGSFCTSTATAQTTNWLGGTGNWFDVSNWDNGFPSQSTDAHIDNGNAINSDVLFNGTGPIGNLTVDAGDTLRIQHARVLSVEDGSNLFTNNGLIQFEGTGFTRILVDRSGVSAVDLTFDGNGTVRLTDGNHSITAIGDPTLVNGINHTIEGVGKVGNTNIRFTNQGLLNGNVNGSTLTIESGDSFINTGTVRASNGGTVNMFSQNNTGNGLYEAIGAGSTVHFFGANVTDATFDGSNGGLVFKSSSGVIDLDNVTNLGSFRAQSVRLVDSLNNQGRFTLINGFNNNIELANDVHVTGSGIIDFAQGGTATTGGGKLFADDVTFEGFGRFETEVQFAEPSVFAPGTSSDTTASFDFSEGTLIAGTMKLELGGLDVNDAAGFASQVNTHTQASMSALDFDQLNVFDSASFLNGSLLDVDLVGGFVPDEGDFFDLVTADDLLFVENLAFDLPELNGLTFDTQVLTLFDPSAGFDRDVLRITYGASVVPEPNAGFLVGFFVLTGLATRRVRRRVSRQDSVQ